MSALVNLITAMAAPAAVSNHLVTIIIPIAPYHSAISSEAIAAAHAQTVTCTVLALLDEHGAGAGAMRNRGIALSDTPFVYFLDADDIMRPDAIERLISHYCQGVYVYSDDWQGDSLHNTEDCGAYFDGRWHTVSCLVPTVYARQFPFDETLPAMEDLAFYLQLQAAGVCGVRCPHPLLQYSDRGLRSKTFQLDMSHGTLKQNLYERYAGAAKHMCNCGTPVNGVIPDNKQEGDMLVQALYTPMQIPGPQTGRLYPRPRGSENYQLWVDPRDAEHPKGRTLWQPLVKADINAAPAVDELMAMARQAVGQ